MSERLTAAETYIYTLKFCIDSRIRYGRKLRTLRAHPDDFYRNVILMPDGLTLISNLETGGYEYLLSCAKSVGMFEQTEQMVAVLDFCMLGVDKGMDRAAEQRVLRTYRNYMKRLVEPVVSEGR